MAIPTETIVRPKSTGWTILIAGIPIAGFGLFMLIGGMQRGVQITDMSGFVLSCLGLIGAGVAFVYWGWRLLRTPKVMFVIHDAGIDFYRMRGAGLFQASWSDIATYEVWRPQALHPGQRDHLSFGLTDAAAERLGLREARPDPADPGHTGKPLPQRLHFAYNAGQLSMGTDQISDKLTHILKLKGVSVTGPQTLHLGVASRLRWTVSQAEMCHTAV